MLRLVPVFILLVATVSRARELEPREAPFALNQGYLDYALSARQQGKFLRRVATEEGANPSGWYQRYPPGYLKLANSGDPETAALVGLLYNTDVFRLNAQFQGAEAALPPDYRTLAIPLFGVSSENRVHAMAALAERAMSGELPRTRAQEVRTLLDHMAREGLPPFALLEEGEAYRDVVATGPGGPYDFGKRPWGNEDFKSSARALRDIATIHEILGKGQPTDPPSFRRAQALLDGLERPSVLNGVVDWTGLARLRESMPRAARRRDRDQTSLGTDHRQDGNAVPRGDGNAPAASAVTFTGLPAGGFVTPSFYGTGASVSVVDSPVNTWRVARAVTNTASGVKPGAVTDRTVPVGTTPDRINPGAQSGVRMPAAQAARQTEAGTGTGSLGGPSDSYRGGLAQEYVYIPSRPLDLETTSPRAKGTGSAEEAYWTRGYPLYQLPALPRAPTVQAPPSPQFIAYFAPYGLQSGTRLRDWRLPKPNAEVWENIRRKVLPDPMFGLHSFPGTFVPANASSVANREDRNQLIHVVPKRSREELLKSTPDAFVMAQPIDRGGKSPMPATALPSATAASRVDVEWRGRRDQIGVARGTPSRIEEPPIRPAPRSGCATCP